MPAPPGEGMTGSPPRACPPAEEAPALEHTRGNLNLGAHRTVTTTSFSELHSIRPLDVRLQDLRPLRGRPPADPGPTRRTGVHPNHIGEEQTWSTTDPAHLTGPAPSGMTLKGCHVRKPSRRRAGTPTGAVVAVSVSTCRRPSLLGSSTVRRPPAASHVMDSPAWTRPPDRAERPPVEGNRVDRSDSRPSPRLGQLRMRTARGVDVQGCHGGESDVQDARFANLDWDTKRTDQPGPVVREVICELRGIARDSIDGDGGCAVMSLG